MRIKSFILLLFVALLAGCGLFGLEEEDTTSTDTGGGGETTTSYTVSGYVQKGPYVQGTEITVRELNAQLSPTGRTFAGTIDDNSGSFTVRGNLGSPYVELSADGYYFNEVSGSLSTSKLNLQALADLRNSSSVNVNLMTHLEKKRVEYLIGLGLSFSAAKSQAQTEILNMFNIQNLSLGNSESLDISKSGDGNAALLAISAILQSNLTEAQLTELLSTISTDIRTDGTLNSSSTQATLTAGMEYLKSRHASIRSNIQNRYSNLGLSASVPTFESYAFKQDTTAPTVVSYSPKVIDDNSSISVTFSEPIDLTSLSTNTTSSTCGGSFQFSSDNFSSCIVMSKSPSASNSDKTLTVTPSNNLSNVTSYQIQIKSSVKDVAGNSLADDYIVSIGVDSYNLITGSITVKIDGNTLSGATSDYWCSPLNNCSCGIGFVSNTSSAQFISSISGTYPPFSYEWYFDGIKKSTSDNLSISYSAGNHKVKLYVTDNQSNRIFAGKTSCGQGEEFINFN